VSATWRVVSVAERVMMPPYIIRPDQLRRLTQAVNDAVHNETFFSH
ncbi:hypothetical protein, partial [Salmonella enterica]